MECGGERSVDHWVYGVIGVCMCVEHWVEED